MTRRPRLATLLLAVLCLALTLGLVAPPTSQARPAPQVGGPSAEQYVDENIQRLERERAESAEFQAGRDAAAAEAASAVNRIGSLEEQRRQLRSSVFGYAWPQPPYPGGPEARPYPWALLGSPFLPVYADAETTFMGIRPPPSDATYGGLVRGYDTPLGFITNFDETRAYGSYWNWQQALAAWSDYLNRPQSAVVPGPTTADAVVAGVRNELGGWVQGEATLAQVRPTPIPTPVAQLVGPGVVVGVVRNATTGRGVTGAVIQGPGGQVALSEAGGRYVLRGLPVRRVELSASIPGYISDSGRALIPSAEQPGQLDFVLSRVLAPGEVRIVLAWGERPRDLDSHVWTELPTGTGQVIGAAGGATGAGNHVYHASPGNPGVFPFVGLDVDDTTSFGPETITIQQLRPVKYTYAVHNFSGESPIGESGARVTVLAGDRVVQRFEVPTSTSTTESWWTVFELDGASARLTPRGELSSVPPVVTGTAAGTPAGTTSPATGAGAGPSAR